MRGRKGLTLVPPAAVRAARLEWLQTQAEMATRFGVSKRTVIRWEKTGLPLYYGTRPILPAAWARYVAKGSPDNLLPVRPRKKVTR
jgi:hypothetical protein